MLLQFIIFFFPVVTTQMLNLLDRKWAERFKPYSYEKQHYGEAGNSDSEKATDVGYTEQGMKDLEENSAMAFFEKILLCINTNTNATQTIMHKITPFSKDEIGDLVGGGDAQMLSLLRPYYSMVEMAANGNRQGMGSYVHVLPDEEYGDKPIYSLGGSFSGGIEPAGMKHGFLTRPLG